MKTKTIVINISIDIAKLLQARIALIEKEELLKAEYKEASKDPDRLKTINEWRSADIEILEGK